MWEPKFLTYQTSMVRFHNLQERGDCQNTCKSYKTSQIVVGLWVGNQADVIRSLSLDDGTGISNVIVNPDLYEKYLVVINREKFLRVKGILQNQDHTISIKDSRVLPISVTAAESQSHDFH